MEVPSVSFTMPSITGDRVTDRERQLEEFLTIFLKDLEYHLNLHVKAINEGSSPEPGPDPPVPPTPPTPPTPPVTATVTGNPVEITDAATGNALKVICAIDTEQAGSGTPSPENIRPFYNESYELITMTRNEQGSSEDPEETEWFIEFPYNIPEGVVYGGTLDVTTGVLTVTKGHIAHYNGETIPGEWLCDRAVYTAGATPPSGSEVVYDLMTPLTYQAVPYAIPLNEGWEHRIFATTGDLTVTYNVNQEDTEE